MKAVQNYLAPLTVAVCSIFPATTANADTFNGPFIGIDIGYDHMEVQDSFTNNKISPPNIEKYDGYSINGFTGGVYVGYDAKLNQKVFTGVELRGGLSKAKYSALQEDGGRVSEGANPSFSATVRLGYLLNENTGLYLRGGVAQADYKWTDTDGIHVGDDTNGTPIYRNSVKDSNAGLLYGAGLEK